MDNVNKGAMPPLTIQIKEGIYEGDTGNLLIKSTLMLIF